MGTAAAAVTVTAACQSIHRRSSSREEEERYEPKVGMMISTNVAILTLYKT